MKLQSYNSRRLSEAYLAESCMNISHIPPVGRVPEKSFIIYKTLLNMIEPLQYIYEYRVEYNLLVKGSVSLVLEFALPP